jgi:hypothetical protein
MRHRTGLALTFALALILRLGLVVATADLPIGLDDMFQYDMLARSIVTGNGYRWYAQEDLDLIQRYIDMEVPAEYDPRGILTSFRPPLYPVFLALVYAVVGTGPRRFLAARLVQALLGAALAPLTAGLGRQAGVSLRASRAAALVVAAYPLLVVYPLALATENLYTPLLVLSLWAILRAGERGTARSHALAGALLGLTALTRSVVSMFVPVVAAWTWAVTRPRGSSAKHAALLALCFLLIVIPWSVRNTILHGEFHFIESALGYDLHQGYHPQSTGTFDYRISSELLPILDDGERHHQGMEAFWSFVRADPARVPYLMFRKLGYFWGLDRRAFQYFYSNNYLGLWPAPLLAGALLLLCGPFAVIAPAGLAGLALTRPRRETILIALFVAYAVGIHMLILAEPRFHVPLVPILALLAAAAMADRPWSTASHWQRVAAGVLVLSLVANWVWEIARDWGIIVALFGPEGNRLGLGY